jgi:hypothetical protein
MGWRYMSLWTIEVFTDPSQCADRIGAYLGLEKVSAAREHSNHGFLEVDVEQLRVESTEGFGMDRQQTHEAEPEKQAVSRRAAEVPEAPSTNEGTAGSGNSAGTPEPEAAVDGDTDSRPKTGEAAGPRVSKESILPNKAAEDDPRRWGDHSGYDHDAWLQEQKPPHWG